MVELKDSFGRKINYLRISVTDRCNLRCYYCVPKDKFFLKKREEMLSFEELERIIRVAASIGIKKIRFTGGEPLLRKRIFSLISRVGMISEIVDLGLTTNGTLLKGYARKLKESGLKRINISLDTLDEQKFKKITGANLLPQVMEGIEKSLCLFEKVKLNVVAVKGTNDDEILDFVEFIQDKPITLRFIEFMPIGNNGWNPNVFLPSSSIRSQIEKKFKLRETGLDSKNSGVELYKIQDFKGALGFISAITKGFCENCNRLRLTADGFLKPCLLSDVEIDIKSKIRGGDKDWVLAELFKMALASKPEKHNLVQKDKTKRRMYQIGG